MIRTILHVDGMVCGMCEAHVNDAVRAACKARKVTSSHRTGEAVVLSDEKPDENALRKALAAIGYTVTDLRTEEEAEKPRFSFLRRK